MRILIIDDDEMVLALMAAVLEDEGYAVSLAANALEGAERLASPPACDLILCDQHMPLLTGIEFFRELRENGRHLPFVLLTGDDPAPLLAAEPRLDACLVKDFDLEEKLPKLVENLLAHPPAPQVAQP